MTRMNAFAQKKDCPAWGYIFWREAKNEEYHPNYSEEIVKWIGDETVDANLNRFSLKRNSHQNHRLLRRYL
jgi:hypothetical protein